MDKVGRIAPGVQNYHLAEARPEYWDEINYIRQALKSQAAVSFLFEPGPARGGGTAMEILMVPMDGCINYGAWRGASEDKPEEWFWVSIIGPVGARSQVIPNHYLHITWINEHLGLQAPDAIEICCLLNDIFMTWGNLDSDTERRKLYGILFSFMEAGLEGA